MTDDEQRASQPIVRLHRLEEVVNEVAVAVAALENDRERLTALVTSVEALRDSVNTIQKNQEIQFTRIAQIQADLDLVRSAWAKVTHPSP